VEPALNEFNEKKSLSASLWIGQICLNVYQAKTLVFFTDSGTLTLHWAEWTCKSCAVWEKKGRLVSSGVHHFGRTQA